MTDTPSPLDPDLVACPRCSAEPGVVCREPNGRKAKRLHAARRVAATGQRPPPRATAPDGPSREARSKGGKATAEARAEARRLFEQLLGRVRARELEERAGELAEDALRWDRDRMTVRRLVLDAALVASSTFVESLEGYRRVRLDPESGRPVMVAVEGPRGVTMQPDYRGGGWGPDDVKATAAAYSTAIEKLRLEEGSATSRSEHVSRPGGQPTDDELAELARAEAEARAVIEQSRRSAP